MTRRPTESDVRGRRAAHIPFRSCCQVCVAGRAKDWPRHSRTHERNWITQLFILITVSSHGVGWQVPGCGTHSDVVLRRGQAPAITSVVDEMCRDSVVRRIVAEQSSHRDSRAHWLAERTAQPLEEMIRVRKQTLESRLGTRSYVLQPTFTWLVETLLAYLNKAVGRTDGVGA